MHDGPPAKPAAFSRRVKLQHLRTVLAVAQTTSLARASEQLGLTQPAITKILHEIEDDLQVQLFTRTSRGTHCTPFGAILADHARLVFAQLDQAAAEIHDSRDGRAGRVTVGALIAGTAALLPRAVAELHRTRPGVRVTVLEGTYDYLIPLLHQGAVDLLVGRLPGYQHREGIAVEPLFQERIALAVRPGHPVLAAPQPSLARLFDWPWILPLPGTSLRQILEAAFHDHQRGLPEVRCESVSVVFNRRLILESDCICAFPWQVIEPDLRGGVLATVPLPEALAFGPVGITTRQQAGLPRTAEELVRCLRAVSAPAPHSSRDTGVSHHRTE